VQFQGGGSTQGDVAAGGRLELGHVGEVPGDYAAEDGLVHVGRGFYLVQGFLFYWQGGVAPLVGHLLVLIFESIPCSYLSD
jgi:hypothetical protein